MSVVVFDIETTADLHEPTVEKMRAALKPRKGTKDEAKAIAQIAAKEAELVERAALSPLTGQVVAIGTARRCEEGGWDETMFLQQGRSEADLLLAFAEYLESRPSPLQLVGFNSRSFDLPFVAVRAALHGVRFDPFLPVLDRRPGRHLDLFEVFGSGKLDLWATRFLGEGKTGEGSDVEQLVLEGRWQELADYCAHDVRLTCALYDRLSRVIST